MDFENRLVSNVKTLETTITFTESSNSNELNILVSGPAGVAVTLELGFKEGGKLTGVTNGEGGNSFLNKEWALINLAAILSCLVPASAV